jgi:hypothetical protein
MNHPSRHPFPTLISLFENYSQSIAQCDCISMNNGTRPVAFGDIPAENSRAADTTCPSLIRQTPTRTPINQLSASRH